MKKGLVVLGLGLTLATGWAGSASADLLDDIKAAGVIRVGTEGVYPPFTFHDEAGKLTGYDVEVTRAVAKALGVKVEFVEAPWDGLVAGLDAKRYDMVANQVEPTKERLAKYDVSNPYTYSYGVLIVNKDNQSLTSFDQVKGKRAIQTLNSNWFSFAEDLGANVTGVGDAGQSFQMVATKRYDFTVNSNLALADFLKQKPNAPLKIVDKTKEPVVASFIFRKGNPELAKVINEAIAQLQASGELGQLSVKFLNTDVSHP